MCVCVCVCEKVHARAVLGWLQRFLHPSKFTPRLDPLIFPHQTMVHEWFMIFISWFHNMKVSNPYDFQNMFM